MSVTLRWRTTLGLAKSPQQSLLILSSAALMSGACRHSDTSSRHWRYRPRPDANGRVHTGWTFDKTRIATASIGAREATIYFVLLAADDRTPRNGSLLAPDRALVILYHFSLISTHGPNPGFRWT